MIEVISDPAAAAVALDPIRNQLLSELEEPASAAALATRLGLARQKVNYHLRALEARNLIVVAEERQWGGLTERVLVSSARSFVVSPEGLGPAAVDPARSKDRLAASYLIALGARIVRDVGDLWRRARQANKRLSAVPARFARGGVLRSECDETIEYLPGGDEIARAVQSIACRGESRPFAQGRGCDPRAKTRAVTAQTAMYRGQHIGEGDTVFVYLNLTSAGNDGR
jgi:DNA-binding transcriptional ArsR family regulator